MSVLRALGELVRASANLGRAKARAKLDPCPPHAYEPGMKFCKKCGQYR